MHPLRDPAPPVAAPASRCPPEPNAQAPLPRAHVKFASAPGNPEVKVEVAVSARQQQRGLMYRTSLGADSGMLFPFPDERPRHFWMRNTCIPLDMLFLDRAGTIVGLLEQVPTLNTLDRSVPCPAAYVLELNAGWARAHGVRPGQRVEIRR